ncbi:MAG TPA: hypothetical protein VLI54_01150 [Bacillota bacterium]|nr:hypothetical protein [Bacillota bacterium]
MNEPGADKREIWEHPMFLIIVGAVAIALIAFLIYRFGWHSGY